MPPFDKIFSLPAAIIFIAAAVNTRYFRCLHFALFIFITLFRHILHAFDYLFFIDALHILYATLYYAIAAFRARDVNNVAQ